MKLLFDENLSPRLVRLLHDLFPGSVHVRDIGLKAADDPVVWKYAQDNALIIS
jgi:predicted nuclease of predicted toxin-antitoxin system